MTNPTDIVDPRPAPRPQPLLSERMARGTTRLIAIAVICGGLLTAALNLWEPAFPNAEERIDRTAVVARDPAGLPLGRREVAGAEAVAREALIEDLRRILDVKEGGGLSSGEHDGKAVGLDGASDSTVRKGMGVVVDREADGRWEIQSLDDVPRRFVGVSREGGQSLIFCWGGYEPLTPDSWSVWSMKLAPGVPGR